jgi:large subunit ribosomal protein L32
MAVPKRKQSHSRTAKRRSQHRITAPAWSACPRCGSPRRPHRVCAQCGTYGDREVLAASGRARAGDHDHEHDHEH